MGGGGKLVGEPQALTLCKVRAKERMRRCEHLRETTPAKETTQAKTLREGCARPIQVEVKPGRLEDRDGGDWPRSTQEYMSQILLAFVILWENFDWGVASRCNAVH